MKYVMLVGRIFYSAIFILASFGHFSMETVKFAAAKSVPIPEVLVPLSGLMLFCGGLSVLLGYRAKWGAWLLVIFLIPTTFLIHNFWVHKDPVAFSTQQAMFLKNLALMGGAIFIAYFGSGPLSLSKQRKK